MQDYYPFGLTFNSFQRENSTQQNYLFNRGSELERGLDLGWYQTPFRTYDPAIGRFLQIDPVADFFAGNTPYNFAENNPVLYGDPSGLAPTVWQRIKAFFGIGRLSGTRAAGNQEYVKPVARNRGEKKPYNFPLNDYSQKPKEREPRSQFQDQILVSEKQSESTTKREYDDVFPDPGQQISITKKIEFYGGEDRLVDKKAASQELDPLIKLLLENPEIKAYIRGNVGDGVASDQLVELNQKLVPVKKLMSARALAIFNFLVEKGVPKEQLKSGPGKINAGEQYDLTITVTNEKQK